MKPVFTFFLGRLLDECAVESAGAMRKEDLREVQLHIQSLGRNIHERRRDVTWQDASRSRDERVDDLCDRFEQAWIQGQRPWIGDYLGGAARRIGPGSCTSYWPSRSSCRPWPVSGRPRATTCSGSRKAPGRSSKPSFGRRPSLGSPPWNPVPFARGGLGRIFRARDVELNRVVALKKIREGFAHYPISRERFLREAETTGAPGTPLHRRRLQPEPGR